MTRRLIVLLFVTSTALTAGPAWAQTPAALTCEDHLMASRVNLNATTVSQVRERAEASREIARLMREIETLQARLAATEKKSEEKK